MLRPYGLTRTYPNQLAPSPTFGEGVEGLARGPRMGLDCGLRRNDGGTGCSLGVQRPE